MENDSGQIHESLYNQAKSLKAKREKQTKDFIKERYTFNPKISKTSLEIASQKANSLSFLKRQSIALEKRDKEIHEQDYSLNNVL